MAQKGRPRKVIVEEAKPLRDYLPDYFQETVATKWDDIYLDLPPVVNKKFPDTEIELPFHTKAKFIDALCNFKQSGIKSKLAKFVEQISKPESKFREYVQQAYIDKTKTIDFDNPRILDICYALTNCLHGIAVNQSKKENKFHTHANQTVNIYRFVEQFNRLTEENLDNPWDNGEIANTNSWFTGISVKAEDIISNPIYLTVTGKPDDILRMALSPIFTSCQDIYSDGAESKKLLANVFDENMSIMYIMIKIPYTDKKGNIHPFTTLSRRLIRKVRTGAIAHRVYPAHTSAIFNDIQTELGFTFQNVNAVSGNGNGNGGNAYRYAVDKFDIYNLPRPYADDGLRVGQVVKWPSIAGLTKEQKAQVTTVKKNPFAINGMEKPCEQAQIVAIKKDPSQFRFLENPSERVKLYALIGDYRQIDHMKEPSLIAQKLVVSLWPDYVSRLEKPPLELLRAAIKKNRRMYFSMQAKIEKLYSGSERSLLRKIVLEDSNYAPDGFGDWGKLTEEEKEELYLVTVRVNPPYIRNITNPSEAIQIMSVSHGQTLKHINNPSEAVYRMAVLGHPQNIQYVPAEKQTEEMQEAAVKASAEFIRYCHKPSEKLVNMAIGKYPEAIQFVENPSERLMLVVVRKQPTLVRIIKNPTENVMLECVRVDAGLMEYFRDKATFKVQLEALKQDPAAIRFINNPSPEIIRQAIEIQPEVIGELASTVQTNEICWLALKKKASTLRFIEKPDEEMLIYGINNGYLQSLMTYDYYVRLKSVTKPMLMLMVEKRPDFFQHFIRYHNKFIDADIQKKAIECMPVNVKFIENAGEDLYWIAIKTDPAVILELKENITTEMVNYAVVQDTNIVKKALSSPQTYENIVHIIITQDDVVSKIISIATGDAKKKKEGVPEAANKLSIGSISRAYRPGQPSVVAVEGAMEEADGGVINHGDWIRAL